MKTWTTTPSGQAAIAYFVYGVVYMGGAVRELNPSRMRDFFGGTVPWWVFYGVGGLFIIILPFLIAKGVRWLMALLGFFTAIKALYLFYSLGRTFEPFNLVFALVALMASVLLFRAVLRSRQ